MSYSKDLMVYLWFLSLNMLSRQNCFFLNFRGRVESGEEILHQEEFAMTPDERRGGFISMLEGDGESSTDTIIISVMTVDFQGDDF